ncbi:MAG: DNA polymerase III subunit psi [Bacteroidota bacterium]
MKERAASAEKLAPALPKEPDAETVASAEPSIIKHDIIVVCDSWSAAEKELLGKILSAVRVDIKDVLLIEEIPNQPMEYERLLIFGDQSLHSADGELYLPSKDNRSLRSKSLTVLSQSQEEKMKLWAALKKWFNL